MTFFKSILTTFELSFVFWGSWGSTENQLVPMRPGGWETLIYSTERDKYKNNGMKNLSLSEYLSISEYIARQIIFLIPQNYNIMCLATVIYSTERDNRKKVRNEKFIPLAVHFRTSVRREG